MKYKDMTYDTVTHISTDTIVVTEKLPWAISSSSKVWNRIYWLLVY